MVVLHKLLVVAADEILNVHRHCQFSLAISIITPINLSIIFDHDA